MFTAIAAVAAALAAVLVLSGCVPWFLPKQAPSTSTPTGEKVISALDPFYRQVLHWKSCGGAFQCTTAKAPLDWKNPETKSISLALMRQPATGSTRLGSLLVNPGGPGASGYDFIKDSVNYATDKKLQASYDIVGFDPRGVGRSSAVKCYKPAQMDNYLYSCRRIRWDRMPGSPTRRRAPPTSPPPASRTPAPCSGTSTP